MARHLATEFAELGQEEIVDQVVTARDAVAVFELEAADALETAELIARYQLAMLAGRVEDVARLDPQPHPNRRRPAAEVPAYPDEPSG